MSHNDHYKSENDIIFICDVDLLVKIDILRRIRIHQNEKRVFFPIFFSKYKITDDDRNRFHES